MGFVLEAILGTILNCNRDPMSTRNGPLVSLILTVAHTEPQNPKDLLFKLIPFWVRGLGFRDLGDTLQKFLVEARISLRGYEGG